MELGTNIFFPKVTAFKKNEVLNLTKKDNIIKRFGPGFTLIELLIVIAIIGILAAIAIPYYQGHVIRARLVEVENAMSNVESAVSSYRLDNESWPNCPTANEVTNSLGVSLGNVTRIGSLSIIDGVITATVQNIHPLVNDKTITLRPTPHPSNDGSFSWAWEWSADFPAHMRNKGR